MAVSKLRWRVGEIATCPICLDEFVEAKSLPCVHSFCLNCLEEHCKDNSPGQSSKCPVCRTSFKIPEDGVVGLPHNFFLKNLVDAKKCTDEEEGEMLCDVCMKEDADELESVPAAAMFCIDCCQKLCKPCSRPHRQWIGGPHQLRDLAAVSKTDELLVHWRTRCQKHETKFIELYCFDCKVNLCMKCFAVSHTQHKCAEIEDVANEFLQRIDADVKQVQNRLQQFTVAKAKLDAHYANFIEDVEKAKFRISEMSKKLKCMIDKHMAEFQHEIDNLQALTVKDIDAQKDSYSLALVALESYAEYATELRKKGCYSDVTMSADKLHCRATELLQTHASPVEVCAASVTVTPSHIADNFEKSGQNIIGSMDLQRIAEQKKVDEEQHQNRERMPQLNKEVKHLQRIENHFEALTDYLVSDRQVIRTITSQEEVRGITSLKGKLCVSRDGIGLKGRRVDVYEMNVDVNDRCGSFTVPTSRLWDITASMTDECIYLSDHELKEVLANYGLTAEKNVDAWSFDFEPRGVSMLQNGNLLVTSRCPSALVVMEYSSEKIVDTVTLDPSIQEPWHAVQLSDGNFAVCHGGSRYCSHRVCVVNRYGNIVRSVGHSWGSHRNQLDVPCHLAVDENDFIFVADCLNGRVTLFTPTLNFVYHVFEKMDSRPQRLFLDRDTNCLYVGQRNGTVVVIQV